MFIPLRGQVGSIIVVTALHVVAKIEQLSDDGKAFLRRHRDLDVTGGAEQTYVTAPGSALLFPSLCAPTGDWPHAN